MTPSIQRGTEVEKEKNKKSVTDQSLIFSFSKPLFLSLLFPTFPPLQREQIVIYKIFLFFFEFFHIDKVNGPDTLSYYSC